MFYLLNSEFTFDVDLSTVGCGMNAAIDFTCMPVDGGKMKYNFTGAQYGTGFCGGEDDPPNCLELDIIEANSLATMYTIHPCNGTKCNAYGCVAFFFLFLYRSKVDLIQSVMNFATVI